MSKCFIFCRKYSTDFYLNIVNQCTLKYGLVFLIIRNKLDIVYNCSRLRCTVNLILNESIKQIIYDEFSVRHLKLNHLDLLINPNIDRSYRIIVCLFMMIFVFFKISMVNKH